MVRGGSPVQGLAGLAIVGAALGIGFTAGSMFTKWMISKSPVPLPFSAYTLPGRGPDPEVNSINVFASNATYDDDGNIMYDYGASDLVGDYDYADEEGAVELPA